MRMLRYVLLGALWFTVVGKSGAQVQRSDGDTFRTDVLPALQLVAEPAFAAIVKPYADCFSTAVTTSSAFSLKDNQTVQSAQLVADTTCRHSKKLVTKEADAALIVRSPSLSAEVRAHLLGKVRRQATFFALMAAYQQAGRGPILQRYLDRIGRESQAGHPVVLLSGE